MDTTELLKEKNVQSNNSIINQYKTNNIKIEKEEIIKYETIENQIQEYIISIEDNDLEAKNNFKEKLKNDLTLLEEISLKYALLSTSLKLCLEEKKINFLQVVKNEIEINLQNTSYYNLFK